MAEMLEKTSNHFERKAEPIFLRLCHSDKFGIKLSSMPARELKINPEDMTHDRFLATPTWAQSRDLPQAIQQLCLVGVIRSVRVRAHEREACATRTA